MIMYVIAGAILFVAPFLVPVFALVRAKPTIRHPVMYYFAGMAITVIAMKVSLLLWVLVLQAISMNRHQDAKAAIDAMFSINSVLMPLPLLVGCGIALVILRRWIYSDAKVDEATTIASQRS
jgi:hypothetical protein